MSATKKLNVAYVLQNTGVNLASDVGAPVLVKNNVRGLQQAGHRVDVFLLQGKSVYKVKNVAFPHQRKTVQQGLMGSKPFQLVEGALRRLQRILNLPYFALLDSLRFYGSMRRELRKYDLCHEYQGLFSFGAVLAAKSLKIPYVITVDADLLLERDFSGHPLKGLHRKIAEYEIKSALKYARKVICVSNAAREHFCKTWGVDLQKIVVIPNGVDVERFAEVLPASKREASQKALPDFGMSQAPSIVFVGGFQPWHGLDLLLDSLALVKQQIPDVRLVLVGDGPKRKALEERIAELNLEASVCITGLLPPAAIPQLLALAQAAVLPYPHLETELWFSPLKLYEYMAAGKAIVASRAGQVAEVIEHDQNGLLVTPGDVQELAAALIALLQDPALRRRLGDNARKQAVEQHSWQQYIAQLIKTYQQALAS